MNTSDLGFEKHVKEEDFLLGRMTCWVSVRTEE